MAGLLKTRTRPTVLERQIRAALRGQWHECTCGRQAIRRNICAGTVGYRPIRCDDCGVAMFPLWSVVRHNGKVAGSVAGGTHAEALESAHQSVQFDDADGFTVVPSTEMNA